MKAELSSTPNDVAILAERCLVHVKNRIGLELDYQSETLSVIDFFVQDVMKEEGGGALPPVGDHRRADMIHLFAPSIGAYFGEVVRNVFPCRWRVASEDPRNWQLEFDTVPLRFSPIGAAAEALAEESLETWSGAIATSKSETAALAERLGAAPPVPEDEFFALTTRFEVLQIAVEWLRIHLDGQDTPPPAFFSPEDYDQIFES